MPTDRSGTGGSPKKPSASLTLCSSFRRQPITDLIILQESVASIATRPYPSFLSWVIEFCYLQRRSPWNAPPSTITDPYDHGGNNFSRLHPVAHPPRPH